MKHKVIPVIISVSSTLVFSNCTQVSSSVPSDFNGDFGQTGNLPIATSDVKVICARAEGKSTGVNVFGIPFKNASETEAIKNMYNDARARGAKIEGESRFFVNKGLEETKQNFFLFSISTLRSSGDLVQYMTNHPVEYASIAPKQREENKDKKDKKDKNLLNTLLFGS